MANEIHQRKKNVPARWKDAAYSAIMHKPDSA